jgi:hypothetical protein
MWQRSLSASVRCCLSDAGEARSDFSGAVMMFGVPAFVRYYSYRKDIREYVVLGSHQSTYHAGLGKAMCHGRELQGTQRCCTLCVCMDSMAYGIRARTLLYVHEELPVQ